MQSFPLHSTYYAPLTYPESFIILPDSPTKAVSPRFLFLLVFGYFWLSCLQNLILILDGVRHELWEYIVALSASEILKIEVFPRELLVQEVHVINLLMRIDYFVLGLLRVNWLLFQLQFLRRTQHLLRWAGCLLRLHNISYFAFFNKVHSFSFCQVLKHNPQFHFLLCSGCLSLVLRGVLVH